MDCFEDIIKTNTNFDKTLNTTISRFNKVNDSKILITESANLAASYEITDNLIPIESWTFPQLNRLSIPLISSKGRDDTQYVYAVQEPNSVTKWTFGDQKKRIEKHLFNSKIIGLIDFQTKQTIVYPIVVFENGFCQSITNAIKTRTEENKRRIISEDESIQFIDGLIDKKSRDHIIIYLITKDKTLTDNTIESVYRLTVSIESDEIINTFRQLVTNKFNNWSLCHKSANILSVSRLEEELFVFSLNGKIERKLFKLNSSSIDLVYSLGTTTSGSVCLIGKTKEKNFAVELWELRYGSLLGRVLLPYEPLTNDCKVIDNKLFITSLKGIVLIAIRIESISLSQIVGKNKAEEPILDSELNQQLKQISKDLESYQTFEGIDERFNDIVRQINGNIPEDMILSLLNICSQKLRQTKSESLKKLFEKLVSLPFNDLFMISRLKSSQLTFQQILIILESLIELLPTTNSEIIDWISIVFDSHMNQFIMNPSEDTIKVIEQIQLKINKFCQLCEQLGEIKTFFEIILSKNVNKGIKSGAVLTIPQRGQYCIEILRI